MRSTDGVDTRARRRRRSMRAVAATLVAVVLAVAGPVVADVEGPSGLVISGDLDFGVVHAGRSSDWRTVVVTNEGDVDVEVSEITVSGDFVIGDTDCGAGLPVDASCAIDVRYEPDSSADGDQVGELQIISGATVLVAMEATGFASRPAATFEPAVIDFGEVFVGGTSPVRYITVTNIGNITVEPFVGLVNVWPVKFAFESHTCGDDLEPGESCVVGMTFEPTREGAWEGVPYLSFTVGGTDPHNVRGAVTLRGSGVTPDGTPRLEVSGDFDFGPVVAGTSVTRSGTVTNVGGAELDVTTSGPSGDFTMDPAADCPMPMRMGASCTFEVEYSPDASADGDQSSQIEFRGVAAGGDVVVSTDVSGFAARPGLSAQPVSLDFGEVVVGTTSAPQSIEITNTGNVPARASFLLDEHSELRRVPELDTCPAEIEPDASCSLWVTYTPSTAGDHIESVGVRGEIDLASGPHTFDGGDLEVTGTGVPVVGTVVAPESVTFGEVEVGATATQPVTITNDTNVAVTVSSIDLEVTDPASPAGPSVAVARPLALTASDGPFSVDAGECDAVLAPGASCTLTVAFAPTVAGDAAATIRAVTDLEILSIPVDGVGLADEPDAVDTGGTVDDGSGQQPADGGTRPGRLPRTGMSPWAPTLFGIGSVLLGVVVLLGVRRRPGA